jgi:hypothetical protein
LFTKEFKPAAYGGWSKRSRWPMRRANCMAVPTWCAGGGVSNWLRLAGRGLMVTCILGLGRVSRSSFYRFGHQRRIDDTGVHTGIALKTRYLFACIARDHPSALEYGRAVDVVFPYLPSIVGVQT